MLHEKGTIHYSITIWFTSLFRCAKPWKFREQRQQWIRNGRKWKRFRRGTWRKSEVRQRWSMKQGRTAQKFTSPHRWTFVGGEDQLASEDHTYKATKEEIDVYRGNWWIHTNAAHFDSVPTKYQPDFKKALSTMHRLKQADDEKKHATWSHNSSSSSWQWHTSWWESDFEYSPQKWYDHW